VLDALWSMILNVMAEVGEGRCVMYISMHGPVQWLEDRGSIPGRSRDFFFGHRVHPASYLMCTRCSYPGCK
jgi:hypothetical protein